MKNKIHISVILISLAATVVVAQDVSGTYDERQTVYLNNNPNLPVLADITFNFAFDNQNCGIQNFTWGPVMIPNASNIASTFDYNENRLAIYFTSGSYFVHVLITIDDMVTSAYDNGSIQGGPFICL